MSPSAYYCWLYERRFTWLGLRRIQPRPDQNFPAVIALVTPLIITGLVLLPAAVLSLFMRSTTGPLPDVYYNILGAIGFTCGVIHTGFAWLVWNQRAAGRRASGTTTPSVRPGGFVCWLVGPFYLLVVSFITPIALLIAIENVRGALMWKRVRTEFQAKGEHLFLSEIVPPPVPDAQNFASIPLFTDLFAYGHQTNWVSGKPVLTQTQWDNTNAMARFTVFALPDKYLPERERERGKNSQGPRTIPLSEWAIAFRTAISNQTARPSSLKKNSNTVQLPTYPAAASDASDAQVVLTALSVGDMEMTSICEASHRPYTRFPIHWEDGFATLLPHLAKMKGLSRFLDMRVEAKVAAGDVSGAFEDAQCGFRIVNALHSEPYLISQLVRFAQAAIAGQSVWHGIALHRWTDAQLQEFQQNLMQTHYVADTGHAIEGERAGSMTVMEQWAGNSRRFREEMRTVGSQSDTEIPQGIVANSAGGSMIPSGWIRQNQASIATYMQYRIDQARTLVVTPPASGLAAVLNQPNSGVAGESALIASPTTPYNIFVKMLLPAFDKAILKGIRSDVTARMAGTGCALERYRIRHGDYPATLAALAPEFLPDAPRDPMDNQPLRYARTSDGLFRLWSTGSDGVDDGGKARHSQPNPEAGEKGLDWVWPY